MPGSAARSDITAAAFIAVRDSPVGPVGGEGCPLPIAVGSLLEPRGRRDPPRRYVGGLPGTSHRRPSLQGHRCLTVRRPFPRLCADTDQQGHRHPLLAAQRRTVHAAPSRPPAMCRRPALSQRQVGAEQALPVGAGLGGRARPGEGAVPQDVHAIAIARALRTCCSTRTTASPSSAAARTAPSRRCTTRGARPNESSSASRTVGRRARAREGHHLLLSPGEQPGPPIEVLDQLGEDRQGEVRVAPTDPELALRRTPGWAVPWW